MTSFLDNAGLEIFWENIKNRGASKQVITTINKELDIASGDLRADDTIEQALAKLSGQIKAIKIPSIPSIIVTPTGLGGYASGVNSNGHELTITYTKPEFGLNSTNPTYTDVAGNNPYFILKDGRHVFDNVRILGEGATTVKSEISTSGKTIKITSTDTNTSHTHTNGIGIMLSGTASSGGTSGGCTINLKTATDEERGGAKMKRSSIVNTAITGRKYKVEISSDEHAFVEVPWTDTDTKVTSELNHYTPKKTTQLSVINNDARMTIDDPVPYVFECDTKGHITAALGKKLPIASGSNAGCISENRVTQLAREVATSAYRVKGTKATIEEVLALADAEVGDVWNVTTEFTLNSLKYPAGTNVVCITKTTTATGNEKNWDPLGGTVDLSPYALSSSIGNGILTITQNGSSKGTFEANQIKSTTISLTDTNTSHGHKGGIGITLGGNSTGGIDTTSCIINLKPAADEERGGAKMKRSSIVNTAITGRKYKVEISSDEHAFVEVPWTDTTYSSISKDEINKLFNV